MPTFTSDSGQVNVLLLDGGLRGASGADGRDGGPVPVGGSLGQVLTKNSGTSGDASWKTLPIYNAKDFGAVGDGSIDDSTAIQSAVNFIKSSTTLGGTLYFPPGTYKITSFIDLTQDTSRVIVIKGASKSSTIFSTTSNITVFRHQEEVVFQDFTVIQSGTPKTGRAFSTPTNKQVAYAVFERIRIRNFKYGMWWRYSLWNTVRNVRISDCAVGIKMSRNAFPDDQTNPSAPDAWNLDPGFFHNQNTFDNVLVESGEIGIWGSVNGNVFNNVTCQSQTGDGAANVAAPVGFPGTGLYLQNGSGTVTFGSQANNIVNYYTEFTRQPLVLEYTKTTLESMYVQGAATSGTAYPQVIKITGGTLNARIVSAAGVDWFNFIIVAVDAIIYGDPAAGTTLINTALAGAHSLTNTRWYRNGVDAGDNVNFSGSGTLITQIATMDNNSIYEVYVLELFDGATPRSAKFNVAYWGTGGVAARIIIDPGNSSSITLASSGSALNLTNSGVGTHDVKVSVVNVRKLGQFPYRA